MSIERGRDNLACGDGYLFQFLLPTLGPRGNVVGVDMSDGELAVAKANYGQDTRIKLHQATAQHLPLLDKSMDAIVCHMAFMLMMPLDPVVLEVSRVLKSGATFSAVIGNARGKGGLLGDIFKFSNEFVDSRYPKIHEAPMGDSRVQSEDNLRDLFSSKLGFRETVDIFDFSLLVKTDSHGVWNLMKDMYHVSILSEDEKIQLESELKKFSAAKADADGKLSFDFNMRRFTVRKL